MTKENGHNGVMLLEVMLRLHGDYRYALKALDLTPLQAAVLLHVQRNEGTGVYSIAEALRIRPPILSPLISGLLQRGLVKEHRKPSDRRTRPLLLTTKARRLLPRITKQIKGIKM